MPLASVVITYEFPFPAEMVWAAWTTDLVRRWFGSDPDGVVHSAFIDAVVGGRFEVAFENGGNEFCAVGTYTNVVPGRELDFTWSWKGREDWAERGSVRLAPTPQGTAMVYTHSDIDPQTTHGYREGWLSTFRKMHRALESSNPSW